MAWNCKLLTTTSFNWGVSKFFGNFRLAGGYGELEKQSIKYANKNRINTNYIYYTIPDTASLDNINLSPGARATVFYYRCQHVNGKR